MPDTTGKADPPPKIPKFPARARTVCASLLLIQFSLALTLFAVSYRKYTTWWRTTRHLSRNNDLIIHTTLFIVTCAPLCASFGVGVAAGYYWRKRLKYGKYDVRMRRKGRGYWVDPSDKDDQEREDVAKVANRDVRVEKVRRERIVEERGDGGGLQLGSLGLAVPREGTDRKESKRVSFFSNPYGWVAKGEELESRAKRDSRRVSFFCNPYEWVAKEEEPRIVGRGLERSDSVRTCESDEVTKKGVFDIWLGRYSGAKRNEDIEMVTRRT